jgi:hypothetical protein
MEPETETSSTFPAWRWNTGYGVLQQWRPVLEQKIDDPSRARTTVDVQLENISQHFPFKGWGTFHISLFYF